MKRLSVTGLLLLVSACTACTIVIERDGGAPPSDPPDNTAEGYDFDEEVTEPGAYTSYQVQEPADDQCLPPGDTCSLTDETDKPCCFGSWCDPLLNEASDLGACTALVEDGGPCWDGSQCLGGYCIAGQCTSTCSAIGGVCDFQGGCCDGAICSIEINFSYGPGECLPPLPNGEYCWLDAHCGSGHCVDQVCGSAPAPEPEPEPEPEPDPFWQGCLGEGAGCAEGEYCDSWSVYVQPSCRPLESDQAWCTHNEMCASGTCFNNQCTSQCLEEGGWCEKGVDACCGANVCLDGGYGFGSCGAPQPSGSFCLSWDECESGWCDPDTATCS